MIIYKDGVKRNSWKMAIIEGLIQGKDDPVRGAKVRVITKGKVVCLNRPMQMLYTLEVRESVPELPQRPKSPVERQGSARKRDIPRRVAALDAAWKTREMINQSNDQ